MIQWQICTVIWSWCVFCLKGMVSFASYFYDLIYVHTYEVSNVQHTKGCAIWKRDFSIFLTSGRCKNFPDYVRMKTY